MVILNVGDEMKLKLQFTDNDSPIIFNLNNVIGVEHCTTTECFAFAFKIIANTRDYHFMYRRFRKSRRSNRKH
jgi:hypothetical protein